MKDFSEYKFDNPNEFWQDAREELGYEKLYSTEGLNALENYAWQEGHSAGWSEVWGYLVDLVELAEKLHASAIK